MKLIIIIKLIPDFISLCWDGILEAYFDVRLMYKFRTDKELMKLEDELTVENQLKSKRNL